MIKKLRMKFVAFSMLIVTIILLVLFCSVFFSTYNEMNRNDIDFLNRILDQPEPPRPPGRNRGGMGGAPHFIIQVEADGTTTIDNRGFYDLSDEETVAKIVELSLQSDTDMGILKDYNLRFKRKQMDNGWKIACSDLYLQKQTMISLVNNSMIIGAAAFFVFLILSTVLSKFVVQPVELAWNQQKRFVADASHELKTPLTVILSNVEMMQAQRESNPAQYQKRIAAIKEEAVRMRKLIEELLNLARLDQMGISEKQMLPVDFSYLITGQILLFEPVAFEQEKQLVYNIRENLKVRGIPENLEQVAAILLDNALKYSFPKSIIILDLLLTEKKQVLLSVANQGEPLTQEQLTHLFERFYRADPARGMDGGYGLGLSIAQNIVMKHKGKIWAESRDGVNTFYVQFPRCGNDAGEKQSG